MCFLFSVDDGSGLRVGFVFFEVRGWCFRLLAVIYYCVVGSEDRLLFFLFVDVSRAGDVFGSEEVFGIYGYLVALGRFR